MTGTEFGLEIVGHGGNTLGFTTDVFFLPKLRVGAVIVVANGGGQNSLAGSIRRRIFEFWFDGEGRAAKRFDYSLAQSAESDKRTLAKTSAPIKAWLAPILGRYHNADLGDLAVFMRDAKPVADAGEWAGTVTKHTESDGVESLLLLDSPLMGLSFEIERGASGVVLLVKEAQRTYRFERKP